jgi:polyribonucleotide nucleotidyltransferase
VDDIVKVGDIVNIKILEIDREGKIRLSIKEAEKELKEKSEKDSPGS